MSAVSMADLTEGGGYVGKRYDAKMVRAYCDSMTDAFNEYALAADRVQLACVEFGNNDTFTGLQAEASKQLVSVGETALIDDILGVTHSIKAAQDRIMDLFEGSVDAAPNALIDEDVLDQINHDIKQYYAAFDEISVQVESIYARLQKFSKYGSFTRPDFDSGRDAAKELCGGDGNGGFINECKLKLFDFDADADGMLCGLGLEDMMAQIASRLTASSFVMSQYAALIMAAAGFSVRSPRLKQYGMSRSPYLTLCSWDIDPLTIGERAPDENDFNPMPGQIWPYIPSGTNLAQGQLKDVLNNRKEDGEYVAAIYLLSAGTGSLQGGAFGAGHSAIILAKDDGTGYIYSVFGTPMMEMTGGIRNEDFELYIKMHLQTYCNPDAENPVDPAPIKLDKFFQEGGYELDSPAKPGDGLKFSPYSHCVYIPISDEDGIIMKEAADQMREDFMTVKSSEELTDPKWQGKRGNIPGYAEYDLLNDNCNQRVQMLLSLSGGEGVNAAGFKGNQFYSESRVGFLETAPNNSYRTVVKQIDNGDFPGWYYGTTEDFRDAYCLDKGGD